MPMITPPIAYGYQMSSQFTPCPTYKQGSRCATPINRSQASITGPCRPWHSLNWEQAEEQSTECGQKTCRDCTLHRHQQCSGRQVRVTDDSSCRHRPGDCGAPVNVLGLSSPQPCTAAFPCCYYYQPPINTYPSLPLPYARPLPPLLPSPPAWLQCHTSQATPRPGLSLIRRAAPPPPPHPPQSYQRRYRVAQPPGHCTKAEFAASNRNTNSPEAPSTGRGRGLTVTGRVQIRPTPSAHSCLPRVLPLEAVVCLR